MKKILSPIIMLALMIFLCSGCGAVCEPMVVPELSSIKAIEIGYQREDIIYTDEKTIAAFIDTLKVASATTKETVSEVPKVLEYTQIDIVLENEISTIFVYQEDSNWYIEQPYQGIYQTNQKILTFFEKENN